MNTPGTLEVEYETRVPGVFMHFYYVIQLQQQLTPPERLLYYLF